MKLAYVEICGFRGYRNHLRIEFADGFTVIDGRNGVGKSTLFDAVEFALTGTLSKYANAKADGESVADYIWWTGDGSPPVARYVEVGFWDGEGLSSVRRSQVEDPGLKPALEEIKARLCDRHTAPPACLSQLCRATIIRDEHITSLSLDLKEVDRYSLLRASLGASDAEDWMSRAAKLVAAAKKKSLTCQEEVAAANAEISVATRRLDEVRRNLVADSVLSEALKRLSAFVNSTGAPDELAGPVRAMVAEIVGEIEALQRVQDQWAIVEETRERLPVLALAVERAQMETVDASKALNSLPPMSSREVATNLDDHARLLMQLVATGRRLGLHEGHCPLCAQAQSAIKFEEGMRLAENLARNFNEKAAREAEISDMRLMAEKRVGEAMAAAESAERALQNAASLLEGSDAERRRLSVRVEDGIVGVSKRVEQLRIVLEDAHRDLRILDTTRLSKDLESARRAESDSTIRLSHAQERYGRARKTESIAQALYDATRRAASETLDQRLDRVLPLMSELYHRLRPHPVWHDIEYSIRGDVRRFLKLKVGENLNPQFLFSSGQRRATGIAFLLSVNLSLAWSRLRTILLDDPVQHVDDFRAVHLAELLAQIVTNGRQVVCAVEDAALADLLCRRLPVESSTSGKRLTLAHDAEGNLVKTIETLLPVPIRDALVATPGERTSA